MLDYDRYSLCKPPILLEEPAARKPKVFTIANGHD
jgi:hypothetical protein